MPASRMPAPYPVGGGACRCSQAVAGLLIADTAACMKHMEEAHDAMGV